MNDDPIVTPKSRSPIETSSPESPNITVRTLLSKTLSEKSLNHPLSDTNYDKLLNELSTFAHSRQKGYATRFDRKLEEVRAYIKYLLIIHKSIEDQGHIPNSFEQENQDLKSQLAHLKSSIEQKEKEIEARETNLLLQVEIQALKQFNILKDTLSVHPEGESELTKQLQFQLTTITEKFDNLQHQFVKLSNTNEYLIEDLKHKAEDISLKNREIQTFLDLFEQYKKSNLTTESTTEEQSRERTYAQSLQNQTKPKSNPQSTSNKAILIRKTTDTATLQSIRELLNNQPEEILTTHPDLTCETSRDNKILILKLSNEEQLNTLYKKLEENEPLNKLAQVELKGPKSRRLIILGVPESTTEEQFKQKIIQSTHLKQESEILIHKRTENKNSNTSNFIISIEEIQAKSLLKKGKILIKFNSCRVTTYRPIIRCNRCQFYGHTHKQCRQPNPTCQFCGYKHDSSTCRHKDNTAKHCCINCYRNSDDQGRPLNYNHTAGSTTCHKFKSQLLTRNNLQAFPPQRTNISRY